MQEISQPEDRRIRWTKYRADHLEEIRAKDQKWRTNNKTKDNQRKRSHDRNKPWEFKAREHCRKRAREKSLPFDMRASDLLSTNTGKLPEFCPIFPHIRLDYTHGPDRRCWASVDRKVPELGYTSANVWVISMAANTWKSNGSNPQERKIISQIMTRKIKTENKTKLLNQPSLFE